MALLLDKGKETIINKVMAQVMWATYKVKGKVVLAQAKHNMAKEDNTMMVMELNMDPQTL